MDHKPGGGGGEQSGAGNKKRTKTTKTCRPLSTIPIDVLVGPLLNHVYPRDSSSTNNTDGVEQ